MNASFAQAGIIGAEIELGAPVVTKNTHCLDPAHARLVKLLPHAATLEECRAARLIAYTRCPNRRRRHVLRRLRFDQREIEPADSSASAKPAPTNPLPTTTRQNPYIIDI